MNLSRILAMVVRYLYNMRHSYDRLSDMFYWPLMDLFIWGMTGLYLAQLNGKSSNYLSIILIGLIFWIVIWRASYEITTNLLSELWDRNLVNLFCSPLKISEWIASFMIIGVLKTIISVSFSATIAYLLYHFSIFSFGWYLIPIMISLLLTGWAGGFIIAAFLIRYGGKIQTIAWAGIALLAPFSAVYYPLKVLPGWAQTIGTGLPSTYMFEGLREILFTGHMTVNKFFISFSLNALFLLLSIWLFVRMFRKSRELGLGRLI